LSERLVSAVQKTLLILSIRQQIFAGEATRLAYMTDEAQEGRDAFLEKRERDFKKFPWHY